MFVKYMKKIQEILFSVPRCINIFSKTASCLMMIKALKVNIIKVN